jgi:LuxR family maltose regulon positive regulatory protein
LTQIDEITRLLENTHTPFGGSLIPVERAWLLLKLGEATEASAWVEANRERIGDPVPYFHEEEAIYLARFLVWLGSPQEALALIEGLSASLEAGERDGRLIEVLVIRALALQSLGEEAAALETLRRVLRLAEPEGYRRTFLDADLHSGKMLAPLLARIEDVGYANKLLNLTSGARVRSQPTRMSVAQSPQYPPPVPVESDLPVEALSEREMEVLRLIAQGYSNQQIAEALVISLNTTKTHVKNILARLRVENRTQAVARARELGIL